MKALRVFVARVSGWIRRPQRERELEDELDAHLALHVEDNIRSGMLPDEARRRALIKLGGREKTREAMRERSGLVWLETIWQDVRYAGRTLRRDRGFALTAILSLALGLGSSIAIVTVTDNLLLRPLPYRDASRLMMVWESSHRADITGNRLIVSPGNYFDWKAERDVFDAMAAFDDARLVLAVGTRVEELETQQVSADLLPLLGVSPVRGRWFSPEEDQPGDGTALIISHRVWQEWFGGAEDIIGRTVQVNAKPRTIVGVMPAGFYFRNRAVDLWQPLGLNPSEDYRKTEGRWMMVVGRLAPGVSQQQAQTRMTALAQRLEAAYPAFNKGWSVYVESLRDSLVWEVRTSLLVLVGAAALLLLVACANVAGLLLARHSVRHREIALRGSLGAGRWRLVRQLLTESLVLGLAGGTGGLLLAHWLVQGLLTIAPQELAQDAAVAIDGRIVLFGLTLTLLTAVGFGLAPAFVTARAGLAEALARESRSHSRGGVSLRNWLVGGEVALVVVLLVAAVLLFRSFVGLQGIEAGLNPESVLTFRVSVPSVRYEEATERTQFFSRVVNRIQQVPGVRRVSAVSHLPFRGIAPGTWVHLEGRPPHQPGQEWIATIRTVVPGYFNTMGIPQRSGRDFSAVDQEPDAPQRFIVNEAFVRTHLRGETPLGTRISVLMWKENPYSAIIGVVGDVKEGALDEAPTPTVYYPYAQQSSYNSMIMVVRTEHEPLALAPSMRRAVAEIDPLQPIADVHTMEAVLGDTLARQRFSAVLMSAFSTSSLLLVTVGLYGLLAYTVSQRTREIGIRVAVGAEPSRVVRLIVGTSARLVFAGTLVGLAGALALSGLLESMLFEVAPRDPLTFVLVPALLVVVPLLAAAQPARRAARLNPVDALRAE